LNHMESIMVHDGEYVFILLMDEYLPHGLYLNNTSVVS